MGIIENWRALVHVVQLKPERPHPPNLVCMHFTSTSTCLNILSWFYFLTPMYSPWFKRETVARLSRGRVWLCETRSIREIWPNLKGSHIPKTWEAMPTKIGLHAFHINPYLHDFFWANSNFWPPWTIVHGPKEKIIWRKIKVWGKTKLQ